MINITVEEAIYVMLWVAFITGVAVLIFNEWDRSIKELDKWENEQ